MARIIAEDQPVRARGGDPRRSAGDDDRARARPTSWSGWRTFPRARRSRFYHCGDFVDLCRGPHVESTGEVKAFKLLSVAGSYFRGDENEPDAAAPLRHGVPDDRRARRASEAAGRGEAARPPQAGPGAGPVQHPGERGARAGPLAPEGRAHPLDHRGLLAPGALSRRLRAALHAAHRARRACGRPRGTSTSTARTCTRRWRSTSSSYFVKPMNCPFHIQIYKSRKRSYRDLPLRWAELGTVYRYEKAGVLHGLLRVRGFTQDDAHIFCTPEQIEDEIARVRALRHRHVAGVRLRGHHAPTWRRGRRRPWASRRAGSRRQRSLEAALKAEGIPYEVDEGGGAFYGPKIDLKIARRHRPRVADEHHPVRLQPARAVRHDLYRRGRQGAPALHGAPRAARAASSASSAS